jgi:hypothetical protein
MASAVLVDDAVLIADVEKECAEGVARVEGAVAACAVAGTPRVTTTPAATAVSCFPDIMVVRMLSLSAGQQYKSSVFVS